jgi:hypothetical protein
MERVPLKIVSGVGDGSDFLTDSLIITYFSLTLYYAMLIIGFFEKIEERETLIMAIKASIIMIGPLVEAMNDFALKGVPVNNALFDSVAPIMSREHICEYISTYSSDILNKLNSGKTKQEVYSEIVESIFSDIFKTNESETNESESNDEEYEDGDDSYKESTTEEKKGDDDSVEEISIEEISKIRSICYESAAMYDTLSPTTELQRAVAKVICSL